MIASLAFTVLCKKFINNKIIFIQHWPKREKKEEHKLYRTPVIKFYTFLRMIQASLNENSSRCQVLAMKHQIDAIVLPCTQHKTAPRCKNSGHWWNSYRSLSNTLINTGNDIHLELEILFRCIKYQNLFMKTKNIELWMTTLIRNQNVVTFLVPLVVVCNRKKTTRDKRSEGRKEKTIFFSLSTLSSHKTKE